jgi:hypothetical protein
MSRALVDGVQRLGRLLDWGSTQLPCLCVIEWWYIAWVVFARVAVLFEGLRWTTPGALAGWLEGRRTRERRCGGR